MVVMARVVCVGVCRSVRHTAFINASDSSCSEITPVTSTGCELHPSSDTTKYSALILIQNIMLYIIYDLRRLD